jgi:hypothetical protein
MQAGSTYGVGPYKQFWMRGIIFNVCEISYYYYCNPKFPITYFGEFVIQYLNVLPQYLLC